MKSLVFEKNLARFAASRAFSLLGSGRGAGIGPLRLVEGEPPVLPGPGWCRVMPLLSGICGSDLATLDGKSSRYFEDLVSFPFVPGHEVVGILTTDAMPIVEARDGDMAAGGAAPILVAGTRVVLEPVLGCATRSIDPVCEECRAGRTGECGHVGFGALRPGLQSGFCADTGGGWSAAGMVAHHSQLHPVPDTMTDEDAVTVEPLACALHAVLGAGLKGDETVAVIGAGTLGLLAVGAMSHAARVGLVPAPAHILVGARHLEQRRLSGTFGATNVLPPDQLTRAVRRASGSLAIGSPTSGTGRLTGGADVVFDCVGSSASIAQALDLVRPRGRIVLVGMPGRTHLDLTPLWHRGVTLVGSYAYGVEHAGETHTPIRTFDLALDAASALGTGRIVSARYPLERFEEAIAHAGSAGRRGAVKVVFDLRDGAGDGVAHNKKGHP